MRDRDSQLIFESYRKRVLVNESGAALALEPAAAGLGILAQMILGASATAVLIGSAKTALEKLPDIKQKIIDKQVAELSRLMSLDLNKIRSHYELINFITDQGNKNLSKIAESFKQPIQIYNDALNNSDVSIDTYIAVLASSISAHEELLKSYDLIEREIDQVISKSNLSDVRIEEIKAQFKKNKAQAEQEKLEAEIKLQEAKNEELRLQIELDKNKGSGGGDGNKPPKGKWTGAILGGISVTNAILAVLRKNAMVVKSLVWIGIILSPSFGLTILNLLGSSVEGYMEAGGKKWDEIRRKTEDKNKQPTSPSKEKAAEPEKPKTSELPSIKREKEYGDKFPKL